MSQWVANADNITPLLVQPTDPRVARIVEWLGNNLELDTGVWTDVEIDAATMKRALKQAGKRNR